MKLSLKKNNDNLLLCPVCDELLIQDEKKKTGEIKLFCNTRICPIIELVLGWSS